MHWCQNSSWRSAPPMSIPVIVSVYLIVKLTIPPIRAPGPGSGGKNRLWRVNAAFNCSHPTAGCTTASISPGCIAMILSMCLKSIQTPPWVAVRAPWKLVPPQYAVTGICRREQIFIIALTSAVFVGNTIMAAI